MLSNNYLRRLLAFCVIISFIATSILPPSKAHAQTILDLPNPGSMVFLSNPYMPVLIKGLKIDTHNPLNLDFIIALGNSHLTAQNPQLKAESEKLIKYFFAALTLPEDDVWVNLSPYEKERIVPKSTGDTEMGRDMLAQDYILKQITASLIYPEKGLGKEFWNRVYSEASKRFGTTQIPVNTFNKVWIVADKASVYEAKDTVLVVDSHLKVMLDEDYLALQKHNLNLPLTQRYDTHSIGANIIREIVIPALTKEVNEGKNFANLRQIFHSIILAKWYKETLKTALLNQVYSNKSKIKGVGWATTSNKNLSSSPNALVGDPQYIYQQYLKAYKKGVFNYIKEDIDQTSKQPIPRKYFSGGIAERAMIVKKVPASAAMRSFKEYLPLGLVMASVVATQASVLLSNDSPSPNETTNFFTPSGNIAGINPESLSTNAPLLNTTPSLNPPPSAEMFNLYEPLDNPNFQALNVGDISFTPTHEPSQPSDASGNPENEISFQPIQQSPRTSFENIQFNNTDYTSYYWFFGAGALGLGALGAALLNRNKAMSTSKTLERKKRESIKKILADPEIQAKLQQIKNGATADNGNYSNVTLDDTGIKITVSSLEIVAELLVELKHAHISYRTKEYDDSGNIEKILWRNNSHSSLRDQVNRVLDILVKYAISEPSEAMTIPEKIARLEEIAEPYDSPIELHVDSFTIAVLFKNRDDGELLAWELGHDKISFKASPYESDGYLITIPWKQPSGETEGNTILDAILKTLKNSAMIVQDSGVIIEGGVRKRIILTNYNRVYIFTLKADRKNDGTDLKYSIGEYDLNKKRVHFLSSPVILNPIVKTPSSIQREVMALLNPREDDDITKLLVGTLAIFRGNHERASAITFDEENDIKRIQNQGTLISKDYGNIERNGVAEGMLILVEI